MKKRTQQTEVASEQEIAWARQAGKDAFAAGLGAAPALNAGFTKEVLAMVAGHEHGSKRFIALGSAYLNGWTAANLADTSWENELGQNV